MHTTASDGRYTVEQVLKHIATRQPHLNVIAITDHDTLDGSLYAYENQHRYPFEVVPGVEVSSRGGHVLALWVTTPIAANMSLEDTVQAIHEVGGIAILAHPFHIEFDIVRENVLRYLRRPQVLVQAGLDAIEVHNAGIVTPGCNLWARIMAHSIGLPVVGCSDAHTLRAIGTGNTRWQGKTAASLRTAIETGNTTAQGTAWNISDYIEYLQTELRSPAKVSLANTIS
jgi:hypothetical protein